MTQAQMSMQSSRLLSLAPEILQTILLKYFQGTTLFIVSDKREEVDTKVRVIGMPSLKLEETCRRLRDESFAARTHYVTRTVVANDSIFLENILPLVLHSDKFKWVREHVTSIHVRNSISMARKHIECDSFVKAFPSLTNIEFHAILRMSWSFEESARPLLPFDSYANKRRLAQELMRGEWNDEHLFAAEKMQMYQLEQVIHRLKLKNHDNLKHRRPKLQFNSTSQLRQVPTLVMKRSISTMRYVCFCT